MINKAVWWGSEHPWHLLEVVMGISALAGAVWGWVSAERYIYQEDGIA